MSSSLWVMGSRPTVADSGRDMSPGCTAGPTVCWRRQWMAA